MQQVKTHTLFSVLLLLAALVCVPSAAYAEASFTMGTQADGVIEYADTESGFTYYAQLIEGSDSDVAIYHIDYTDTSKDTLSIPDKILVDGVTYNVKELIPDKSVQYQSNSDIFGSGSNQDLKTALQNIKKLVIPASVEKIDNSVFYICHGFESVTFAADSKLKYLGSANFDNCKSLKEISFPESLEEMGEISSAGLLQGCTSLESITIPKNLKNIATQCFMDCANLQNVTFEEGSQLEEIGSNAFANCNNLKSITLPASLKILGGGFGSCAGLEVFDHSAVTGIEQLVGTSPLPRGFTDYTILEKLVRLERRALNQASFSYLKLPASCFANYAVENADHKSRGYRLFVIDKNTMPASDIDAIRQKNTPTMNQHSAFANSSTLARIDAYDCDNADIGFFYSEFANCPNLETIAFHGEINSVDAGSTNASWPKNMFQGDTNLKSIIFEDCKTIKDVVTIGYNFLGNFTASTYIKDAFEDHTDVVVYGSYPADEVDGVETTTLNDFADTKTGAVTVSEYGIAAYAKLLGLEYKQLADTTKVTATIDGDSFDYVDTPVEPKVVVKDGDEELDGSNYSLTYYDNDKKGTGHVLVSGLNEYSAWSTVLEFEVTTKLADLREEAKDLPTSVESDEDKAAIEDAVDHYLALSDEAKSAMDPKEVAEIVVAQSKVAAYDAAAASDALKEAEEKTEEAKAAQEAAERAKADAEAAQEAAETAKADAETAKEEAEAQAKAAADAQTAAEEAETAAKAAETAAKAAQDEAKKQADAAAEAEKQADAKAKEAAEAKDQAEAAKTEAGAAKTAAETAKTAAEKAKADADAAQEAAKTAKDDAEAAKTAAEKAKADADEKAKAAEAAQDEAAKAVTAAQEEAGKAQQAVTDAKAQVEAAQKAATDANEKAEAVEKSASDAQQAVTDAKAETAAAQQAATDAKAQVEAAQKAAADAQAQASQSQTDLTSIQAQLAQMTKEITALKEAAAAKANNTMTVTAKKKNVKLAKVKKKAVTVKAITVKNAVGNVSYAKAGGSKKLTVNKTTGKIKVKKGTKKGTYKIKVKVTAAGNDSYASATKTVTAKVVVKK